jgi:glutathione synthase/RimK-type ligase-like ATP-grasp enzyme
MLTRQSVVPCIERVSVPADIAIVTADAYEKPNQRDPFHLQVMLEDAYLAEALEQRGLCADTVSWSNPAYDWDRCGALIIRSTWDYLERLPVFEQWLRERNAHLRIFNPYETVHWNLDKRYLIELEERGVRTVETRVIPPAETIRDAMARRGWDEAILKPAVSAGGRYTYRVNAQNCDTVQRAFKQVAEEKEFVLQPFQRSIVDDGELSYMVIAGRFTHAVRKCAKPGDFRVQDDHGGTVAPYTANAEEIALAESVVAHVDPLPVYARVDVVRDNDGALALMELELIEPELFFRFHRPAAHELADAIRARL